MILFAAPVIRDALMASVDPRTTPARPASLLARDVTDSAEQVTGGRDDD